MRHHARVEMQTMKVEMQTLIEEHLKGHGEDVLGTEAHLLRHLLRRVPVLGRVDEAAQPRHLHVQPGYLVHRLRGHV